MCSSDLIPWTAAQLQRTGIARSQRARRLLSGLLSQIDRAVPSDPAVEKSIEEHQPDLILATPLLQWNSPHFD